MPREVGRLATTLRASLVVVGAWLVALGASATPAAAKPQQGEYRVETVSFYSDVFDKETELNIAFPPEYETAKKPLPILYFLHGGFADHHAYVPGFLEAARETGAGGYVVVFPDECRLCNYSDGLTVGEAQVRIDGQGQVQPVEVDSPGVHVGTPWERYFLEDLIPYVESTYNVRTDRGGRGITGHSMGAVGTGMWVTRHPDLFAFAWAMSGALDMNPYKEDADEGVLARTIVYGDPVTHEWRWMDNDPHELATNLTGLAGDSVHLGISSGDGRCSDDPEAEPGFAGGCEQHYERERVRHEKTKEFSQRLDELGVPHTLFLYGPASHRDILPAAKKGLVAAETAFKSNLGERPDQFNYKSMGRAFSAWGYDVRITRPNREFLQLEDVGSESLRVRGTGRVTITTAPLYKPSRWFRITLTQEESESACLLSTCIGGEAPDGTTTHDARSDAEGRLRISFRAGPDRIEDQRYSWGEDEESRFPVTRIAIERR